MAQRTTLAAVLDGLVQNVDLTADELVLSTVRLGGLSGTLLTQTILDGLIANSHASGSDNQNVVAGSGLTGGGSGATVNISVDSTVVRTNGANAFSANQSMGGNKITNLANGTASTDAVAFGQLGNYIPTSEKGANNGVATLDSGGKIPVSQLPNSIMEYQGNWNASTNSPTLADGIGNTGDVYRVNVAGTQNLGSGAQSFQVGDWVVYNSSDVWEKSSNSDSVSSVNGQTGVVVLDTDDISEGSTNKYFTAEAAQDAVGAAVTDTNSIDFTYNDASNQITADVKVNAAGAITISGTGIQAAVDDESIEIALNALQSKLNAAGGIVKDASGLAINLEASNPSLQLLSNELGIKFDSAGALSKGASGVKVNVDGSSITISANALQANSVPLVKRTMVAGESFAADTSFLVRLALNGETAGRVYKATSASAVSNKQFWAIGIVNSVAGVSAGGSVDVILVGSHTLGTNDTPFNSSDIGLPVWLTTAGAFSITAPSSSGSAAFKVGSVEATNKVFIDGKQLTGIN